MQLHIDDRKCNVQIGKGNNGTKIVFAVSDAGASEMWDKVPNSLGAEIRRQWNKTYRHRTSQGWAIIKPSQFAMLEEITVKP